jgi:hypothetical protein
VLIYINAILHGNSEGRQIERKIIQEHHLLAPTVSVMLALVDTLSPINMPALLHHGDLSMILMDEDRPDDFSVRHR